MEVIGKLISETNLNMRNLLEVRKPRQPVMDLGRAGAFSARFRQPKLIGIKYYWCRT
jgi:hypothetical protein